MVKRLWARFLEIWQMEEKFVFVMFGVVCWFFAIIIIGVFYQNRMNDVRREFKERETAIVRREEHVKAERKELQETREELEAWDQALSAEAQKVETDKKLYELKQDLEDQLYPEAK